MARNINGFVGTYSSIAELSTKFPPSEYVGCNANVGTSIPYTKAWCDGNTWSGFDSTDVSRLNSTISNDGTRDVLRLPANSWLQLGVSSQGSGKELVNFTEVNTNATSAIRPTLMLVEQAINPGAGGTFDWHGIDAKSYGGGSNANFSANSGIYAVEGKTQFSGTAGQTMGKTVGVFGSSMGTGSSYTLNLSIGVQGETQNTGAGTTVAGRAFSAKSPNVTAGAITTAYGFYAEDFTTAGTNYSIYTNAGRVQFFGNVAVPAGGTAGVGVAMSSTANLGVFFGSGAPTLSAAQGSLYMRTDGSSTSTRLYVNTNGSTGWTAVTTAA